jgi:hypothetical protein
MLSEKKPCIYCDTLTRKGKKGEHILQEAIGGARTLLDVPEKRYVCIPCNTGALSEVDKEFTSKSYLSIVASQEIGAYLAQVWNIDCSADNLLIEAEPKWIDGELADLRCYPQITFEKSGPQVRGDALEMHSFGRDSYYRVLTKAAKAAFQRHIAGKKALHIERVEAGVIETYRLAPRLFTRKPIWEIAKNIDKASFTLRYANEPDKRFALKSLDGLSETESFRNWKLTQGSFTPRISFTFNVGHTIRGLMKIAVNLVAACCPNTPVSPRTFEAAIRLIQGEMQISPELISTNGFVAATGIQNIKAQIEPIHFALSGSTAGGTSIRASSEVELAHMFTFLGRIRRVGIRRTLLRRYIQRNG